MEYEESLNFKIWQKHRISPDFDLIRIEAYDGIHYLRKGLIKSISQYKTSMYMGDEEPIDVNTKLLYDNGEIFYFTDEVDTVILTLIGEW